MWQAEGGKGTVYLLGTIHLGTAALYPLDAKIEKAFASSDALIGEIDPKRSDTQQVQQLMSQEGVYPEGDDLKKHLSAQTAAALDAYLRQHSIDAAKLARLKPWLASMTVTVSALQQEGFDAAYGVDKHFFKEASEDKKPTGQLESAEFQVRLLSSFSDDLQDKLLYSSLLEAGKSKDLINQMMRDWQDGDATDMERLITKDERDHPELTPLFEKVIYDRNKMMAQKIEGWLDRPHKYFVVVGVAHLLGERGIISLLRKDGKKVVRLARSQ